MPAGGVGCSPLPCLRRLFTHDDEPSDRRGPFYTAQQIATALSL